MATTQLRPMAMGEILDASFALLRRHAGVFFGVAIVCQGVPTALSLFVEFNGGARQHFGLYAFSQLLSFVGYLLITGASIRVVSQAYLGNEPSLSDALDFAFGKLGRTLAAGFATGVLVVFAPLPGGTDGLGRSWSLTQGFKWRAFGLYAVVIVLVVLCLFGFAFVAGLAAAFLPLVFVPAMIGFALVFLFFYPFTSCVFTLFYYDLRVRKEAFDLELLSQHLGIAAARA